MSISISLIRRFMLLLLVMFLFAGAGSFVARADAQDAEMVEVKGTVPWNGNEEQSRNAALNDAKMKAVYQVNNINVSASELKNYVKRAIITGGGHQGKDYVINAVVLVYKGTHSGLNIVKLTGDPRIMVVIPETSFGRIIPDPAAETELIRNLLDKGFRVIESSEVAQIRYTNLMEQVIKEADIAAMKRIGAKYHCDILIAGEAFSSTVDSPIRGYMAAEARVEAKAFKVDTGEILAADGERSGGSALSVAGAHKAALKRAATLFSDEFIEKLKERYISQNVVSVNLTGVTSATQLYEIQAALKKIAGVIRVQRRNFSLPRQSASLDVETSLKTDQLSRQLERIQRPHLKIMEATGSRIEVRISGK